MMADIGVTLRITPDHARSLGRVYERTLGRTTPAAGNREPFQTPGKTS
jgi:hypothetical protein